MNNKHILGLVIALITCNVSLGQWTKIYDNPNQFFSEILFTSDSVGYAIGGETPNSIIVKTTNAGQSWVTIYDSHFSYIDDISFPSDSIGYALNTFQGIIKTIDAGSTWTQLNTGISGWQYSSVFFMNKDTGFVSLTNGSGPRLLYTYDGGQIWNILANVVNSRAVHGTKDVVYAVRSVAYKSTDAGQLWSSVPIPLGIMYENLYAVNDTIVYALGIGSDSGDPCSFNHGLFARSINGGLNWDTTEFRCPGGTYDLHFPSIDYGYITGAYNNEIRVTRDGGNTWMLNQVDTGLSSLTGIFCTDTLTCYVTTGDGKIYKTMNGGAVNIHEVEQDQYQALAYPNPFAESTTIMLKGGDHSVFDLVVYDQLGREVKRLRAVQEPEVSFSRESLSNGMYFYQVLEIDSKRPIATGKVIIQ